MHVRSCLGSSCSFEVEGLTCQRADGGKERDHKYLVKEKRAGRSEDCGDEHRNKRTQAQKRQGREGVGKKEIVATWQF